MHTQATRAGLIAATFAVLAGAATAQTPADQPSAWWVECSSDGKTLDCRAIQQLYTRDTRQLLISILVRQPPDAKNAVMMVQLPLGVSVTEPTLIRVDTGAPERQPIQTCTNTGCFVGMPVPEPLLTAMRTGKELKVAFQDANKQTIEITVPLFGFGLAHDKVK